MISVKTLIVALLCSVCKVALSLTSNPFQITYFLEDVNAVQAIFGNLPTHLLSHKEKLTEIISSKVNIIADSIERTQNSVLASQQSNIDTHFIGCVDYDEPNYYKITSHLVSHEIRYHVIYSSAASNTICIFQTLSATDLLSLNFSVPIKKSLATTANASTSKSSLKKGDKFRYRYFIPVPDILKLDTSLLVLLHTSSVQWSIPNSSGNPTEAIDKQHSIIATRANTEKYDVGSHPILFHVLNQAHLELIVMFDPNVSIESQRTSEQHWLTHLSLTHSQYQPAAESFELHNEEFWSKFHYSAYKKQTQRKKSSMNPSAFSKLSQYDEIWKSRVLALKSLITEKLLGLYCGWESHIETSEFKKDPNKQNEAIKNSLSNFFKRRRDSVSMKLTAQMHLDNTVINNHFAFLASTHSGRHNKKESDGYNLTTSDTTSLCLSYLSVLISSDPRVIKVALSPPMRVQNSNARGVVQSGTAGNEPYSDANLKGQGVIVGMADTGVDVKHCMFVDSVNGRVPTTSVKQAKFDLKYRKVIQYVDYSQDQNDVFSGHGSHVSGTLVGSCAPEDLFYGEQNIMMYHGMAPEAKLAVFDIGEATNDLDVPEDLHSELFPPGHKAGARVFSNSWGGSFWYDGYAIEVDQFLYENDDSTVFFAAGNEGYYGKGTVLSPGLSKNAVAVAASNTFNSQVRASFSAQGPTADRRIKPDISAPGTSIISVTGNGENSQNQPESCNFGPKSGTSMATPVSAGNTALVMQYFKDTNREFWYKICNRSHHYCKSLHQQQFTSRDETVSTSKVIVFPSGYLVKAVVLHSGTIQRTDGKSVTWDFELGFGAYTLTNVLPLQQYQVGNSNFSQFSLYVDDYQISSFIEISYTAIMQELTRDFIVTLCWYDPQNSVYHSKSLLHDLDLILITPSNTTIYGNQIYDISNIQVRDEFNNVEKIILPIEHQHLGAYTIKVQSKFLTEAVTQNYALVITLAGYVIEGKHHTKSMSDDGIHTNDLKNIQADTFQYCSHKSTNQQVSYYKRKYNSKRADINSELLEVESKNQNRHKTVQVNALNAPMKVLETVDVTVRSIRLELSLFNRVTGEPNANGERKYYWSNSDQYVITPLTSDNVNVTTQQITGKYIESPDLMGSVKFDSRCIKPACYTVELQLSQLAHPGTQLSIPACNIYLTAIYKRAAFCISNYVYENQIVIPEVNSYNLWDFSTIGRVIEQGGDFHINATSGDTNSIGLDTDGFSSVCATSCELGDHVSFDMMMYDETGEGWYGAFYGVHKLNAEGSLLTVFVDNLASDFSAYSTACIPLSVTPHSVGTTYSSSRKTNPESTSISTVFPKSASCTGKDCEHLPTKSIQSNKDNIEPNLGRREISSISKRSLPLRVPEPPSVIDCYYIRLYMPQGYFDDGYYPEMELRDSEHSCPFYFQANLTTAKFCIDHSALVAEGKITINVDYFESVTVDDGFGMMTTPSLESELKSKLSENDLVYVGSCKSKIISKVKSLETKRPVGAPASKPTFNSLPIQPSVMPLTNSSVEQIEPTAAMPLSPTNDIPVPHIQNASTCIGINWSYENEYDTIHMGLVLFYNKVTNVITSVRSRDTILNYPLSKFYQADNLFNVSQSFIAMDRSPVDDNLFIFGKPYFDTNGLSFEGSELDELSLTCPSGLCFYNIRIVPVNATEALYYLYVADSLHVDHPQTYSTYNLFFVKTVFVDCSIPAVTPAFPTTQITFEPSVPSTQPIAYKPSSSQVEQSICIGIQSNFPVPDSDDGSIITLSFIVYSNPSTKAVTAIKAFNNSAQYSLSEFKLANNVFDNLEFPYVDEYGISFKGPAVAGVDCSDPKSLTGSCFFNIRKITDYRAHRTGGLLTYASDFYPYSPDTVSTITYEPNWVKTHIENCKEYPPALQTVQPIISITEGTSQVTSAPSGSQSTFPPLTLPGKISNNITNPSTSPNAFESTTPVNIIDADATKVPSKPPPTFPTMLPAIPPIPSTSVAPSISLTSNSIFASVRYPEKTCFSECVNYPGLLSTVPSDIACRFLNYYTYSLCNTYDLITGICKPKNCTASCDLMTYCYYGVLSVSKCDLQQKLSQRSSLNENAKLEAERNFDPVQLFAAKCYESLVAAASKKDSNDSETIPGTNDSADNSNPLTSSSQFSNIYFVGVIILVVFILCGCFQYHYAVITSALCGCRSGTQTSVALANRGGSRASRGLERHRDDSDKRELLTEMGLLSPRNDSDNARNGYGESGSSIMKTDSVDIKPTTHVNTPLLELKKEWLFSENEGSENNWPKYDIMSNDVE